jgi:predicted site-specific integrase-resolvase
MEIMKSKEVCEFLKISQRTLFRLEERGQLIPYRKNGRKYYFKKDVLKYLNIEKERNRKTIAYYRVSSNSQKKELENQLEYIQTYAINSGKIIDEYIKDIGSGINYRRKGFLKMLEMVLNNEIEEIIITYKDRLVRFGFELLEFLFEKYNVKLTIINLEKTSPEDELITDLMTIIHVFSARLYGLRNYKNKIKDAIKNGN